MLRTLADTTRGVARADLGAIWDDLTPVPRSTSVAHWLWLAAVVVLLLEVLERRTAWVSQGVMTITRRHPDRAAPSTRSAKPDAEPSADRPAPPRGRRAAKPAQAPPPRRARPATTAASSPPPDAAPTPPPAAPAGLGSILEQAKRNADRRTGQDR